MYVSRTFWLSVLVCIISALCVSGMAQNEPEKCHGDMPFVQNVTFVCKGGAWRSEGSASLGEKDVLAVNGLTIIEGDLVMRPGSLFVYSPPELNESPLLIVQGCATFNNSAMMINLTREVSKALVYAPKKSNHWLYMRAIDAACIMNVNLLALEESIDWDYGIEINSTLITSAKNSITFFDVAPGHSSIQIGLLGGFPISSLSWFPAIVIILLTFLVIIIASNIVEKCLKKRNDKDSLTPSPTMNGDDTSMVTLDD